MKKRFVILGIVLLFCCASATRAQIVRREISGPSLPATCHSSDRVVDVFVLKSGTPASDGEYWCNAGAWVKDGKSGDVGIFGESQAFLYPGTFALSAKRYLTANPASLSQPALVELEVNSSNTVTTPVQALTVVSRSSAGSTHAHTSTLRGSYSEATHSGSGALTTLTGTQSLTVNNGGGAITNMYGHRIGRTNTSGTAALSIGLLVNALSGAGVTDNSGVTVDSQTAGTNNAGLTIYATTGTKSANIFMGAAQGTALPAGNWSLYSASANPSLFTGPVSASVYQTATNCADSAGAADCGSAAAGAVVIDAGSTSVVVSTTSVTANSQIVPVFDSSLGTRLGVTCNATVALPTISARTAGTSFTITVPVAPTGNPGCFSYAIIN
jgi:hypothetical protein